MTTQAQRDRLQSLRVKKTPPLICGAVYAQIDKQTGIRTEMLMTAVVEAPNGRRTGYLTRPNRGTAAYVDGSAELATLTLVSVPDNLDLGIEGEFEQIPENVALPGDDERTQAERTKRIAEAAKQLADAGKDEVTVAKLLGTTPEVIAAAKASVFGADETPATKARKAPAK